MTTWGATAKGPTTVRAEALGYTKEVAGFEVVATRVERRRRSTVAVAVAVAVELHNQESALMAKATVDVELPAE